MRAIILAAVAAIALAGCASYGYPGSGSGYGYPGGGYGQAYGQEVVGTVVGVDRGRIILQPESGGYGYGGQQVALYNDNGTTLYYRGQRYPVEGLERGDVIRAVVSDSRGRLYTRQIEVVRNIREAGGQYGQYPGQYPGGYYGGGDYQALQGRVSWVDERAQVIRLDAGGYGQLVDVRYDSRTTVEWQGRRYPARDLDPGDVIRVEARRSGNSWFAERIWMERNAGR